MKNTEFIELLNLYLDHEISQADAARLEAEVQNNPERRRVYQQYCQMQKACKLLVTDFQSEPVAGASRHEKVPLTFESALPRRMQPRQVLFYSAGAVAAAAACVALILSGRGPTRISPDTSNSMPDQVAVQIPVSPVSTSPASSLATGPARGGATASGIVQRPVLVSNPLLLGGSAATAVGFASTTASSVDELAWVRTLELAPLSSRLQVEDLQFDTRPATLRPEARVLGGSHTPADASSEMTAFRFVK